MKREGVSLSTREKSATRLVVAALITAMCIGSGVALAQSYDPDQTIPKPTKLQMRLNKLGRGVTNILFGWAEIPLTFDKKLKQGRSLSYLLGAVPVLGTAKAVMRTGAGVYEVLTFPATKKGLNYGPILEPEYIF